VQVDDQVHEYRENTDPTHGLPERVPVYGIKKLLSNPQMRHASAVETHCGFPPTNAILRLHPV